MVKVECPPLEAPTERAVDALEAAARQDPATAHWVVELNKHYDKLDAC